MDLKAGHGWADLGARWDGREVEARAEVGERTSWGAVFADAWANQNDAGIGIGVRW